jgi:hypothetical protein
MSSAEISINTPRADVLLMRSGQVVLQGQGQLVMHVDLDGDEQKVAHLKNRNTLHRLRPLCRG